MFAAQAQKKNSVGLALPAVPPRAGAALALERMPTALATPAGAPLRSSASNSSIGASRCALISRSRPISKMHARIGLAPQIIVGLQKNLEKSREVFFAELRSGFRERWPLIRCSRDQIRIRAAHARDQQVAHVPDGFTAEMLKVTPFLLETCAPAQARGPPILPRSPRQVH